MRQFDKAKMNKLNCDSAVQCGRDLGGGGGGKGREKVNIMCVCMCMLGVGRGEGVKRRATYMPGEVYRVEYRGRWSTISCRLDPVFYCDSGQVSSDLRWLGLSRAWPTTLVRRA